MGGEFGRSDSAPTFVVWAVKDRFDAKKLGIPHPPLWRLARSSLAHCPVWMQKLPAYGIGIVAAYWTIDRVFGFLA